MRSYISLGRVLSFVVIKGRQEIEGRQRPAGQDVVEVHRLLVAAEHLLQTPLREKSGMRREVTHLETVFGARSLLSLSLLLMLLILLLLLMLLFGGFATVAFHPSKDLLHLCVQDSGSRHIVS